MKILLFIGIFLMGLSGLLVETILIRELLIVFSGNEFCIGIVIANWLIFESMGSLLAVRRASPAKAPIERFSSITILFFISLFFSIFITRNLKNIMGLSIGETIGIFPFFYSSALIIFPTSITHGALFTISCEIFSLYEKSSISVGKVYLIETLGTIFGGFISTYFLFPYINTFEISSYIFLANLIICFLLVSFKGTKNLSSKILATAIVSLVFLNFLLLFMGFFKDLNSYSIKKQWKEQNLIHYENSKYGNISIIENEEQYIFFQDGSLALIIPVPDTAFLEEFINLPLLFHKEPRDILLIGIGAGGAIYEVLKHPSVENIEYLEIDPLLLNLIKRIKTPLTEKELENERVKIINLDGRFYLKKTSNLYDLIILGISEPSNIQDNRFFTKEFFEIVKSRLKKDGIFVFSLTGSLRLSSPQFKNLNSCIYYTLKEVFSFVKVFPGEGRNLFFSSNSKDILEIGKFEILKRINERGIKSEVLIPWHIENKFHFGWQELFYNLIQEGSKKINVDFYPIAVFYAIGKHISIFEPSLLKFYEFFEKIKLIYIIIFFAFLYFIYSFLRLKRKLLKFKTPFVIITSGFAGMVFDLILIFAFQCIYGYIFSLIGLLISFFMSGSAFGAFFIIKNLDKMKDEKKIFIFFDLSIILLSLIFPILFYFLNKTYMFYIPKIPIFLFLLFSFLSGFLIGAQFPLASRIYLKQKVSITKTAGVLYACDLAGGFLGGAISSLFLLPVSGIFGASIFVFLLKSLSFLFFIEKN